LRCFEGTSYLDVIMNLFASFNKRSEFVGNNSYTLYIYQPYKLNIQTLVAIMDFRIWCPFKY
jgi:hypothetical protein